MVHVVESLETVLTDNPDKTYCASCLADAAGLDAPEDRVSATRLVRNAYTKVTDRIVQLGTCGQCGIRDWVVLYQSLDRPRLRTST
jgi:hypothetical protein